MGGKGGKFCYMVYSRRDVGEKGEEGEIGVFGDFFYGEVLGSLEVFWNLW